MMVHIDKRRNTVTPTNGTFHDSYDSSDRDGSTDWKDTALDLKEENQQLRDLVVNLKEKVATLCAEAEVTRLDVIAQSQKIVECDQELYKRIGEYTKETLF